jgi:hypothetical protein
MSKRNAMRVNSCSCFTISIKKELILLLTSSSLQIVWQSLRSNGAGTNIEVCIANGYCKQNGYETCYFYTYSTSKISYPPPSIANFATKARFLLLSEKSSEHKLAGVNLCELV